MGNLLCATYISNTALLNVCSLWTWAVLLHLRHRKTSEAPASHGTSQENNWQRVEPALQYRWSVSITSIIKFWLVICAGHLSYWDPSIKQAGCHTQHCCSILTRASPAVHMDNIAAGPSQHLPFLRLKPSSHSLCSLTTWNHEVAPLLPTPHCSYEGLWYDPCAFFQREHSGVCRGEGTHFSYVSELKTITELSTFISSSSADSTPIPNPLRPLLPK